MHLDISKNLQVNTGTIAYSQAFAMKGNALQISSVVFAKTGSGELSIVVEGSNDLANWTTTGITGSAITLGTTVIGFVAGQFSTIAYAYIRVKFSMAANSAILNCDGNMTTL